MARRKGDDPVAYVAMGLVIAVKMLFAYMRFRSKARRAARTFRRAAVRNGLDRRLARELSEGYADTFSMRQIVRMIMGARGRKSAMG
jgi:hypothetical protein